MSDDLNEELPCTKINCPQLRVSGSAYCEDHLLEQEVAAHRTPTGGSLADLIRKAKGQGLIQPVASGYQSTTA